MKYTVNINQLAAVELGDIDLIDCAIIDWIRDMCISQHPSIVKNRDNGYTWISYSHLMNDMPLLGFSSKASVQKRLKKLFDQGYFTSMRKNQRILVRPLEKLDKLYANRTPECTALKKPYTRVNSTVHQGERNRTPGETNHYTNTNTKISDVNNGEEKSQNHSTEKSNELIANIKAKLAAGDFKGLKNTQAQATIVK